MSVCIHIRSSIKLVFVHANVVGDCKDTARWLLGLEHYGSFLEVLCVVARLLGVSRVSWTVVRVLLGGFYQGCALFHHNHNRIVM